MRCNLYQDFENEIWHTILQANACPLICHISNWDENNVFTKLTTKCIKLVTLFVIFEDILFDCNYHNILKNTLKVLYSDLQAIFFTTDTVFFIETWINSCKDISGIFTSSCSGYMVVHKKLSSHSCRWSVSPKSLHDVPFLFFAELDQLFYPLICTVFFESNNFDHFHQKSTPKNAKYVAWIQIVKIFHY